PDRRRARAPAAARTRPDRDRHDDPGGTVRHVQRGPVLVVRAPPARSRPAAVDRVLDARAVAVPANPGDALRATALTRCRGTGAPLRVQSAAPDGAGAQRRTVT